MGTEPTQRDREPASRETQPREFERFDPVAFVEGNVWTFAKTMSQIPHEYVVRGKKGCDAESWDRMLDYIRDHGYWARWSPPGGRVTLQNIYLELGDYKYWCNYPVINRELLAKSRTVPMAPKDSEEATRLAASWPRDTWGHAGFPYPQKT